MIHLKQLHQQLASIKDLFEHNNSIISKNNRIWRFWYIQIIAWGFFFWFFFIKRNQKETLLLFLTASIDLVDGSNEYDCKMLSYSGMFPSIFIFIIYIKNYPNLISFLCSFIFSQEYNFVHFIKKIQIISKDNKILKI